MTETSPRSLSFVGFSVLFFIAGCANTLPAESASSDVSGTAGAQPRPRYEIRCDARPDCEAQAQRICPRGYADHTADANVARMNDASTPRNSSSTSGASDFQLSASGVQRIVVECNERNF